MILLTVIQRINISRWRIFFYCN